MVALQSTWVVLIAFGFIMIFFDPDHNDDGAHDAAPRVATDEDGCHKREHC